ncbi:MAG: chromosomal replication initiator protein DnaA [Gemmatimonadales bacterium]|nr:chromosomal replication initiator protein DnaA [Gemmatimonadales bacterium]
MMNLDNYWPEILDVVRQKVPQQTFNTWFLPLHPKNTKNGDLLVNCPNHFFRDWFSEHHLFALNEAGCSYFGKNVDFSLVVDDSLKSADLDSLLPPMGGPGPRSVEEPTSDNELPDHTVGQADPPRVVVRHQNLNPDYTFDNFVVGSGADLAFAAATAISNNPGARFNPLFIHGGVGLGKTHLMHAIGNEIAKRTPELKISCVTAEHFMNDLISSIRDNRTPDFKLKYRTVDVLLVDDVAFLAGKESTQEEFFHTFNALYDFKKQIVLTSDRSPKEITTLEERLRSRFEWGLITDIQPPNLETRIAILKRKIKVNRIYITDDVVSYIAENITDNIRRLEGALIRLLAFASLTGREISLEMASEVLSSFFQGSSPGPVKIADIMDVVAESHDLTVDQLKSKRRTQDLARARQIAMFMSREMTDASLNQIGRSFGNRDHSTVSHACQKIQKDMGIDPRFRGAVKSLQDRVRSR